MRLSELSWPDVPVGSVLVVPLGSCEQHGPHLPLDTDTRIAVALSEALVDREGPKRRLVLGPPIGIGASGEHEDFPGTLSIGTVALEAVIVELCRSALPPPGSHRRSGFRGVVLVNAHGGNEQALRRATGLLAVEGRDVRVWHPRLPGGDSHAGRTETSLLLHLAPGAVDMDRAEEGSTARWREIAEVVTTRGLAAVTPNGILGDATTAGASEGAALFSSLVDDLCAEVGSWCDTLER